MQFKSGFILTACEANLAMNHEGVMISGVSEDDFGQCASAEDFFKGYIAHETLVEAEAESITTRDVFFQNEMEKAEDERNVDVSGLSPDEAKEVRLKAFTEAIHSARIYENGDIEIFDIKDTAQSDMVQKITFDEVCDYFGYDPEDLISEPDDEDEDLTP